MAFNILMVQIVCHILTFLAQCWAMSRVKGNYEGLGYTDIYLEGERVQKTLSRIGNRTMAAQILIAILFVTLQQLV